MFGGRTRTSTTRRTSTARTSTYSPNAARLIACGTRTTIHTHTHAPDAILACGSAAKRLPPAAASARPRLSATPPSCPPRRRRNRHRQARPRLQERATGPRALPLTDSSRRLCHTPSPSDASTLVSTCTCPSSCATRLFTSRRGSETPSTHPHAPCPSSWAHVSHPFWNCCGVCRSPW